MKNRNIHYKGGDYICFKCQYLWPGNSLLKNITNLEILPYLLHFSEVLKKINYQIFCRVTYVTGCYGLTLPLSEG